MSRTGRISWIRGISLAALTCLGAAATATPQGLATLEAAGGQVVIIRQGQPQPISRGMALERNDIVVTKLGRASVRFVSDGTVVRVGPDSRVQIDESATQRDITAFFGRLWAHVVRWKERPTRFATSGTIAAVRGTELTLAIEAAGERTQVAVIEGKVLAENDAGRLELTAGQVATARKGSAPVRAVQVRPADAVQWALYYFPVLTVKPGEFGTGAPWQAKAGESEEAWSKGDLAGALASLEGVADADIRDPRFFTYRASLLLAAGSVEDAAKQLDRADKLAPGNAESLALQAIIAVARNENDNALALAGRSVSADSKSAATGLVALSYAQQATFDLQGARASLDKAVALEPTNALAWGRLAEIRSSLGERSQALEAARKGADLAPNLARPQTVLGFAYLTEVRTGEASAAFEKAINLDQSDPLPRLGLGLARIRDGKLTEGTKDIEVAVSLDPGGSLLRSYLGKAYFEQKREGLVGREYDLAKQKDPKDPTPYLYDAIDKQTTNRPVEALEDVQKAIELNDNRAVYRSRLLLDADLAARSASLGRIYNDLGFQDVGLVEGWTSVNTDPTDYSGHRLLADNYAALPRHEIARVSELFQSQMLQPLNTTPIQPSLGESNLFLIASQGPSTLSFNEFNPLFNRNQVNVQGGFMAAEDSTWAGDGIVSGIYDKFSFSGGYSGYKTDGFRENNNQDDKIANGFAQVELSPSTSIQGEVRYRKLQAGDLSLNFFPDDFSPHATRNEDRTNVRVGLRQELAPGATFLVSYMHSDQNTTGADPNPDIGLDVNLDRHEKANSVEGQFLYRSPSVKVVGGAGYFDIGTTENLSLDISFLGFTNITANDKTDKHTNLYAYAYVPLPTGLTFTLGLSGDFLDETGTSTMNTIFPDVPPGEPSPSPAAVLGTKNQANPKVGATWSFKSGTTLRAAWFKTLTRTLVTDQTLEPTQVAGFNQFYDEPSATQAKVWGVALDQKLGGRVFGGGEYSRRELTIPFTSIQIDPETGDASVSVEDTPGDERLGRAYLFAAPHPWVTFGAEYEYEKLERSPDLGGPYSTVKTQRVPLSARFFHPCGIGAFLTVSYFKQDGQFGTINEMGENVFVPGESKFWIVDAGLRYRLPKRYGFIVVGANNLTDERSTYQATDPNNLEIRPGRLIYGRVVLAFP
jgi:tetratricopeptide (TPR) repeat protein